MVLMLEPAGTAVKEGGVPIKAQSMRHAKAELHAGCVPLLPPLNLIGPVGCTILPPGNT